MFKGIICREFMDDHVKWAYTSSGSTLIADSGAVLLSPTKAITYEANSGFSSDITTLACKYKAAVVANRRTYVGNVRYTNKAGEPERKASTIIKTPVNAFDSFSEDYALEVSVDDGDEIVVLETYADRLLCFKRHKMLLINISGDMEYLEETYMHKGVSIFGAVCKTDYGIAWVNQRGCYLYDGKRVVDLLEKEGRRLILQKTWEDTITQRASIGYVAKRRQIMVCRDIDDTGTGGAFGSNSGDIFLYDLVNRAWMKGVERLDDEEKTNFIVDWNSDLVYYGDDSIVEKWVPEPTSATNIKYYTKDFDFGDPGVRKKIYKVYVSYKGDGSNAEITYAINGDTDTVANFYRTNADGTSSGATDNVKCLYQGTVGTDDWVLAELKPVASINNIYSFAIRIAGTSVAADFEINDISIVYRSKNIK